MQKGFDESVQDIHPASRWVATEECIPQELVADQHSESCCRICLEPCTQLQYCRCSGSLLCHQLCLRYYLNTQAKNSGKKLMEHACEICKQPYSLQIYAAYRLSFQACCQKIKRERTRCLGYSLLFAIVISYEIFMAVEWANTGMVRALLLIIGVIMTTSLLIGLSFWSYEFCLRDLHTEIRRVLPHGTSPVRRDNKIHPT